MSVVLVYVCGLQRRSVSSFGAVQHKTETDSQVRKKIYRKYALYEFIHVYYVHTQHVHVYVHVYTWVELKGCVAMVRVCCSWAWEGFLNQSSTHTSEISLSLSLPSSLPPSLPPSPSLTQYLYLHVHLEVCVLVCVCVCVCVRFSFALLAREMSAMPCHLPGPIDQLAPWGLISWVRQDVSGLQLWI